MDAVHRAVNRVRTFLIEFCRTGLALALCSALAGLAQTPAPAGLAQTPPPPVVPTEAAFSLGEGKEVRVSPGKAANVILRATLSGKEAEKFQAYRDQIELRDCGSRARSDEPPAVEFSGYRFLGSMGLTTLYWSVAVRANGITPETTQNRLVLVLIGAPGPDQRSQMLEYILTSKTPEPKEWSIQGESDSWNFLWSQPAAIRTFQLFVDNRKGPAASLGIAASSFHDSSGYAFGPETFRFAPKVDSPAAAELKEIEIPGYSISTVLLRARTDRKWGPNGKYTGFLRFALGKAVAPDIKLTIQSSSLGTRLAGIGLVALGLGAFYLLNAWFRPRQVRLQALRPCVALREGVDKFFADLAASPDVDKHCAAIKQCAAKLKSSFQPDELDKRGLLPVTFGLLGETAFDIAPLRAELDAAALRLGILVVLRNGIQKLVTDQTPVPAATQTLVKGLDDLAASAPDVATATAAVATAQAAAAAMALVAAGGGARVGGSGRVLTVESIDYAIRAGARLSWLLWGVISLAIGSVWIISSPAFGTAAELLGCFLWGLGVTTLGAGIQNLVPTAVASQVQLKLPR